MNNLLFLSPETPGVIEIARDLGLEPKYVFDRLRNVLEDV